MRIQSKAPWALRDKGSLITMQYRKSVQAACLDLLLQSCTRRTVTPAWSEVCYRVYNHVCRWASRRRLQALRRAAGGSPSTDPNRRMYSNTRSRSKPRSLLSTHGMLGMGNLQMWLENLPAQCRRQDPANFGSARAQSKRFFVHKVHVRPHDLHCWLPQ